MFIALIPFMNSILDFIAGHIINLAGGVGAIILAIIVWMANKYLVPYLKVEKRRRYAEFIATIADEVTDELRLKYPDRPWAVYLDEAVDKIIEICGINSEIARRAAVAALSRK